MKSSFLPQNPLQTQARLDSKGEPSELTIWETLATYKKDSGYPRKPRKNRVIRNLSQLPLKDAEDRLLACSL